MAKIVYIADVCKEIFAGGDVPKSALSYEKTAEYNVPIFSNGEKNCGLYGYTNNARVKEPSITVSARGTIGYTAIRTEPFVPVVRLMLYCIETIALQRIYKSEFLIIVLK